MRLFFSGCLFFLSLFATAQSKFPPLDKSPMDMNYYPDNYPILKIQDKVSGPLLARVVFSRPQKNGRNVFGELLEYNKLWRMGANEATEIEFYKDVMISGKVVPKGRYTMYAIPNPEKWTVIINKDTDMWGAFKYDSSKDVVKVDAPVQKINDTLEAFTIIFEKGNNTSFLFTAAWDNVSVSFPITPYEKSPVIRTPVKKTGKKK